MRRFNKIWRSVNLSTAKEKTLKINGNRKRLKNNELSTLSGVQAVSLYKTCHILQQLFVTLCNDH